MVAIGLAVVLVIGGVVAGVSGATRGSAPAGAPVTAPAAAEDEGSATVQLSSDAARYPGAAGVLAQLQLYFDAINEGDYAKWVPTITADRAARLSEKDWKAAYRSTKDGTIRIDRIDGTPTGDLLVRVRFTSLQALADAPADLRRKRICWRSTLPMTGSPPRIGSTQGGSSVKAAC